MCAPYSHDELDRILLDLPKNKSSGYDRIPNELLRNCGVKFRQYLITFLNRIMEDGIVPEDLNKGKCILIHKVSYN